MAKLGPDTKGNLGGVGPDTKGNLGGAGPEKKVDKDLVEHAIGRQATAAGLKTRREDPPHPPADGLPRDGRSADSGINGDQPLPHDLPVDSWGKPMSSRELLEAGADQTFIPYKKNGNS